MTTTNLMSSTAMSPELEELLAETAGADIPVEMRDLSSLLQAISKELVAGDPRVYPRSHGWRLRSCRATKSASWSKGRSVIRS